jgi:spore germination protein YaaH
MGRRLRALAIFLTLVATPAAARAAVWGFVSPDDPRSAAALAAHGAALDGAMPVWLQTLGDGEVHPRADPAGLAAVAASRAPLAPVVQNAALGRWYGTEVGAMLADPARRAAFLDRLQPQLAALGAPKGGVVFDLEALPPSAQAGYLALLAEARARFRARGWPVWVAAPCCDPAWDLGAYGRAADRVIVMVYDAHWPGGEPGPIAPVPWFRDVVARAASVIPKDRLVVGLASYAYDWPKGGTASSISVEEARARVAAAGSAFRRDAASGEMRAAYSDATGVHDVWLPDAGATRAQVAAARALGVRRFTLWRLGLEDPAIWPALAAAKTGPDGGR